MQSGYTLLGSPGWAPISSRKGRSKVGIVNFGSTSFGMPDAVGCPERHVKQARVLDDDYRCDAGSSGESGSIIDLGISREVERGGVEGNKGLIRVNVPRRYDSPVGARQASASNTNACPRVQIVPTWTNTPTCYFPGFFCCPLQSRPRLRSTYLLSPPLQIRPQLPRQYPSRRSSMMRISRSAP